MSIPNEYYMYLLYIYIITDIPIFISFLLQTQFDVFYSEYDYILEEIGLREKN